jgi:DNA-binding winged helix-turn-helix (wHTH) protein
MNTPKSQKVQFGVFEVDLATGELRKAGTKVKLQDQPFQILSALLERPGEIVSREDLRQKIWRDDTFIDFDQGLSKAVNKIREALGDSADNPRFVETLARRGYRFIAPVEMECGSVTLAGSSVAAGTKQTRPSRRRTWVWLVASGVVLAIVLGTGLWPIDVPQAERVVQLTNDATLKGGIGRLISDGNRVLYGDGTDVWSVPAAGGAPKRLSLPFLRGTKILAGHSPIRQQILLGSLYTGKSNGVELWLAGTEGEAPHKIAELKPPCRGALAPDAERIAFSTPDGIYIQSIKNGERKRVHPMTGMNPNLPWWHPSGRSVGFLDPPEDQQKTRAWQVNDDGTDLRRIVPETERGQGPGAWSQDGKRFFYLGGEGEVFLRVQAGILGWLKKPVVTRLTASGQFRTPPAVDPANPRRLYAVGSVLRGETTRYDRKARRWVPFLGGFSGEKIDRSPDGRWLAYITFPGSELHKCRIDGSSDVLLAPGVEAVNPSWSPDGRQIAFSGRPVGTFVNFKLWLVSPDGGDAALYAPGIESGYDTIWSGDGKRILLGQGDSAQSGIKSLHLKTGELESIAGTERLFSPRWSPDEKQIIAMEVNTRKPHIFDSVKGEWRTLSEQPIGYPTWSRDGKYIYGEAGSISAPEAIRIEVATGRREEIVRADFKLIGNSGPWLGWTEDWEPLVVRDLSSTQVYRIDLDR